MIRIYVQCASPIGDNEKPCEAEIQILAMDRDYVGDATALCETLKRSLPQATFYRLLCEMLCAAPVMYIGPIGTGKAT